MTWYRVGTVTVTNGSTTVTGVSTDFGLGARVGDAFIGPNGALHEVTNIASVTVISIAPAYGGPTAAGAAYTIAPIQGYVKYLVDQAAQIIQTWGTKLAALGDVSSENVVPVAKGGTGATTAAAARTALGLGTAATRTVGTATGNLMEKGAFGFGATYSPGLSFVANMNSGPADLGFYGYTPNASGAPSANGYGAFINIPIAQESAGLYGVQLALDHNTPNVAVRRLSASAWSAWSKFYTSANTTVAADGTLKAI